MEYKTESKRQESKYIITVNWRYSEPKPAFRRLMAILLRENSQIVDHTSSGKEEVT